MKYISLFSGIGGMELGIGDRAECVGFSEIDKYAIQIYQSHFNHKNYGDITKIDPQIIPDIDFLVGGFPCQSFSIAGQRKGFADTRGTLFFDIARILQSKKPNGFLLENVKGLLSHDNGRTFRTIIATLDELGYDLQWQVLNSKNFGVPQNRERVYIVGHLRGTTRPQVFPIGANAGIPVETDESKKAQSQAQIASTIRTKEGTRADDNFIIHNVYGGFGEENVREFHDISPTIRTAAGGGHIPMVVQTPRGFNKGGSHEISPTLGSHAWEHNNHLFHNKRIRKLTPIECERLQGFPDNWTAGVSDTQRYKTIGNAVTVNVIREIMNHFL